MESQEEIFPYLLKFSYMSHSFKKPPFNKEYIIKAIKGFSDSMLQSISEEWLGKSKSDNIWETQEEFKMRKDFVLPTIINEKLDRYELGESFN